jgi:hypothetical protein
VQLKEPTKLKTNDRFLSRKSLRILNKIKIKRAILCGTTPKGVGIEIEIRAKEMAKMN